MSGNSDDTTDAQSTNTASSSDTKYSTSLSPSDDGVESLASDTSSDAAESAAEVSPDDPVAADSPADDTDDTDAQPRPEDNATTTYTVGLLPPTFEMVCNPAAWHPSWGPVPNGYENIVSRTQTLETQMHKKLGETDSGQPVKHGVTAKKRGNYTNTPDGFGATVGGGWNYHLDEWQQMERELAGDGVELSGSSVARVEAATAERAESRERRQQLPSQQDVHTHYTPDGDTLNSDSDVMTLWDEADDDTTAEVETFLGDTIDVRGDPLSMYDAYEEVREYTMECAERRAKESREAVTEMNVTNAMQPAFEAFDENGDRTAVSTQATNRARDHRPFDIDFMRPRPLGGFYPKWGSWEPDTKTVSVGPTSDAEVTVATDPIAPIAESDLEYATAAAQRFLLSPSLLDSIDHGVIQLFDRIAECQGLDSSDTFFADYSDDPDVSGPHPAAEACGVHVAADGSIPATAGANAPGQPGVSVLREAYEQALTWTFDPIDAFQPALEYAFHGDATQSLATVEPDWPGCSVFARVSKAYVPNHPQSQQQVVYLEDAAPHVGDATQVGDTAKLTIWRKSNIDTTLAVGDYVLVSNPEPSAFRGNLTLAATGDTTITRVIRGDGPIKTWRDAWELSDSALNDGAQRVGDTDPAPAVGGTITDDDDITRLPNKRYRPVGATIRRGPPEDDKNTRVHTPLAEQACPQRWVYPMTDWVREHASLPAAGTTAGRDTRGEAVSATTEPATEHSDITRTLSPDVFRTVLSRLDPEPLTPGGRTWDARDVGASVEFFTTTQATDVPELAACIDHHPHAPDHLELRVFSGITLSDTASNANIRIIEWDLRDDSPVSFFEPVSHTIAWQSRLLSRIRGVRERFFDSHKPDPEVIVSDALDESQVIDLDESHDSSTEWEPRLITQDDTGAFQCPVDDCPFTHPTNKQAVISHMGGRAQACDDHAATLESPPADPSSVAHSSRDASSDSQSDVDVIDI